MPKPSVNATGTGVKELPWCKRYITSHDAEGKSIYAESPDQVYQVARFGGLARSYCVSAVPAILEDDVDLEQYRAEEGPTSYRRPEIVCTKPGPNLVVVDFAPGASGHMHQTVSLDYSICVIGELDHELDGGEVVRLHPGVSPLHYCQYPTVGQDSCWINAILDATRLGLPFLPCALIIMSLHIKIPLSARNNIMQDHIVQRGTMHKWSNPSPDKPARFVAVSIPCTPFDIAGEPLKEIHLLNKGRTRKGSKL